MAQEDVNLLNANSTVLVLLLLLSSKYQDHECNQYWMAKSPSHPMMPTRIGSTFLLLSTILFATSTYPVPVRPGGTAVQLNDCVGSPSRGGGTCEAMRESNLGPVNSWRYPVNRSIVFDFDGEI